MYILGLAMMKILIFVLFSISYMYIIVLPFKNPKTL